MKQLLTATCCLINFLGTAQNLTTKGNKIYENFDQQEVQGPIDMVTMYNWNITDTTIYRLNRTDSTDIKYYVVKKLIEEGNNAYLVKGGPNPLNKIIVSQRYVTMYINWPDWDRRIIYLIKTTK